MPASTGLNPEVNLAFSIEEPRPLLGHINVALGQNRESIRGVKTMEYE